LTGCDGLCSDNGSLTFSGSVPSCGEFDGSFDDNNNANSFDDDVAAATAAVAAAAAAMSCAGINCFVEMSSCGTDLSGSCLPDFEAAVTSGNAPADGNKAAPLFTCYTKMCSGDGDLLIGSDDDFVGGGDFDDDDDDGDDGDDDMIDTISIGFNDEYIACVAQMCALHYATCTHDMECFAELSEAAQAGKLPAVGSGSSNFNALLACAYLGCGDGDDDGSNGDDGGSNGDDDGSNGDGDGSNGDGNPSGGRPPARPTYTSVSAVGDFF
jgi:hypothetical protein